MRWFLRPIWLDAQNQGQGTRLATSFLTRRSIIVAPLGDRCVEHRKTVIIGTVVLFGVRVATLAQVPEQFSPVHRPEVIDLWLPEGSASRKQKRLPSA